MSQKDIVFRKIAKPLIKRPFRGVKGRNGGSHMCQFSSTDQEELETDSTVHEILDEVNEEVQDVDKILLIISQTTK